MHFIGIFLFTVSGLFLHLKEGFRDIKNESTYRYLSSIGIKNYELDNGILKKDSWRILREIYKNENYGVDNNIFDAANNFSSLSSNKNVLIVGNSHSKDLFNVFFNSEEIVNTLNVARYGIQVSDINNNFYNSDAYLNSQAIVLVSRYDERDLLALYDVAKKIVADKKTLFITEEIFNFPTFGSSTLADYLVMKNARDNASSSEDLIELINMRYSKFFAENSSTKDFYYAKRIFNSKKLIIENKLTNVIFLDRNDYVCPNNFCYGVTPDGLKTFYDYGHHTLVGAKYFGENLKNTKFYSDLLNGLEL